MLLNTEIPSPRKGSFSFGNGSKSEHISGLKRGQTELPTCSRWEKFLKFAHYLVLRLVERRATSSFCNTSAKTRWTHDFDIPDSIVITSQVMCVLLLNGSNNDGRCVVYKSSCPTRAFLLFGSVLTLTKPFGSSWNFATICHLITRHFPQQIMNSCWPTTA